MRTLHLMLLLAGAGALAQTTEDAGVQPDPSARQTEERHFLRTFARDEWRIWTSPFRTSSYSASSVKKYVVPFTLITGTLIATDRKTSGALPNTQDQKVWSGRISQIGAAYTLAGGSGTMYLFGRLTGDKRAAETGWLGLQAIAHTQLIVFTLKQVHNRRRPLQDGNGIGFWQGGDAFPSGHSATSFAVATIVAREYSEHIAVPIAAYSLAALVSASRVGARRHWLSDVFVGGSTGFLVGSFVFKQHHNPDLRRGSGGRGRARRLVPEFGIGPWGAALSWRL